MGVYQPTATITLVDYPSVSIESNPFTATIEAKPVPVVAADPVSNLVETVSESVSEPFPSFVALTREPCPLAWSSPYSIRKTDFIEKLNLIDLDVDLTEAESFLEFNMTDGKFYIADLSDP